MEAVQNQTQFQTKVAAELWLNLGGKEYRLVGKSIRIGRAPDNDIILDDKSISRYHALISIAADQVVLEDLKSRNGLKVNSSRVRRAELKDGDEIQVGDLSGVFFQKLKNSSVEGLRKISIDGHTVKNSFEGLKEKFQNLDQRKKMMLIGAIPLLLIVLMVLSSGGEYQSSTQEAASVSEVELVQQPIDRREFDRCQELEDLGNFRQATKCLKAMPRTSEVQAALSRVQTTQERLTERRFAEGKQAFDNYYFDVAVQKWQEVLLVADDQSPYWGEALKGINEAEGRMRQR